MVASCANATHGKRNHNDATRVVLSLCLYLSPFSLPLHLILLHRLSRALSLPSLSSHTLVYYAHSSGGVRESPRWSCFLRYSLLHLLHPMLRQHISFFLFSLGSLYIFRREVKSYYIEKSIWKIYSLIYSSSQNVNSVNVDSDYPCLFSSISLWMST